MEGKEWKEGNNNRSLKFTPVGEQYWRSLRNYKECNNEEGDCHGL